MVHVASEGLHQGTGSPERLACVFRGITQLLASPPLSMQIVALVLVCAPVIWSLGCVYSMTTGSPLGLSMYKIYTVLVRTPGEQGRGDSADGSRVHLLWLLLLPVASPALH